jgi:hypothetical protein
MFDIIFKGDTSTNKSVSVIKENVPTVEEAGKLRSVNGDIVVHHGTADIVTDRGWLQDCWLKDDNEKYAERLIAEALEREGR